MPLHRLTCAALLAAAFVVLGPGRPAGAAGPADASAVTIGPAIAMHGDVKYGAGFQHFDYADPAAAKGGDVKLYGIGTFDSFNPFILRGLPAGVVGSTFDTLTVASADEPFTRYGLVAETIEVPADRSWVAFTLRPEARFHDGSPITIADVIFTFEILVQKGHPLYRSYYASVDKVEQVGERKVKFTFKAGENRELPLIVAELPVLSKKWWEGRDFEKTLLEPPLGNGPYKVEAFEAGRFVTLRRVPDYWAAKLAVNVGRNNFDTIRYDYYRDQTVALEAFKAGEYDIRLENSAKNWATGYDVPALKDGLIRKVELPEERVAPMQGLVFNTRRAIFRDRRVREALGYAFDFEWSNRTLFYGAYARTKSYFDNSELAARGLPEGEELKLLERFRGQVPEEVFTKPFVVPTTDGSGQWRDGQRAALRLLREAGWTAKDQRLVNAGGEPFSFEILLSEPALERVALPYAENLRRLGIDARVRTVDTAQYQNRSDNFDFDMTVGVFAQSESPGNEQRDFWYSTKADVPGSRNLPGIKDPVVDQLVDLIIAAPDRASLVARTRALDRVLLWGFYLVPQYHNTVDRIAYWDRFAWPKVPSRRGFDLSLWWLDAGKDKALSAKGGRAAR